MSPGKCRQVIRGTSEGVEREMTVTQRVKCVARDVKHEMGSSAGLPSSGAASQTANGRSVSIGVSALANKSQDISR